MLVRIWWIGSSPMGSFELLFRTSLRVVESGGVGVYQGAQTHWHKRKWPGQFWCLQYWEYGLGVPPGLGGPKRRFWGGGRKGGGGAENAISRKPTLDRGRLTLNPPIYTVFKIAVFGPILPPPIFPPISAKFAKKYPTQQIPRTEFVHQNKNSLDRNFPGRISQKLGGVFSCVASKYNC